MRKLLLGAVGLTLALSLTPAHAERGNGCVAPGQGDTEAIVCTYTAKGPGKFAAATPNSWSITVTRIVNNKEVTLTLASSTSAQVPSTGDLATQAADKVTVTLGPDCVSGDPTGMVCGTAGILVAGETE